MPRVNLLYVVTKLELGGAQKQLLHLIRRLDQEKYRIFLFTAQEGELIPEAQALKGLELKRSRFLERPLNPLNDALALIELCSFIKNNAIQIIHTHSSKAGILGRIAGALTRIPLLIHTVHGWSFNDYQPFLFHRLYLWLERFCAKFTHKIIVVSEFDRAKGLKNSIGHQGQYCLIRYGLEMQNFQLPQSGSVRKELGISSASRVVGMVACFKPQKAPLDFIALAAGVNKKFPGTKFVLVGDGGLRKKIERRIRQLGLALDVVLTGWRADIPAILDGLDVLVLTSLWEGLPIVILEAMAAGVSIVATDTGGIREVVEDGRGGYLVKPHDIRGLQTRVEELLADANKREAFTRYASGVINRQDFSLERMTANTDRLYFNLRQS